mgnify:CR=1 FL=1
MDTMVGRGFSREEVRAKAIPAYMGLIKQVDDQMGRLFDWLAETGRDKDTMIVLTSDHGGGVPRKTHTDITCPLNFRIAFLVWAGGGDPASDLYKRSALRVRPGREEIGDRDAEAQPIRNGDAGNVALQLLGLPPIPGSYYGSIRPMTAADPVATRKSQSN